MASEVFSSLLSSCQCKQRLGDRAIETPSYSYTCSRLGDADSFVSRRPSTQGNNSITGIPIFHDAFPSIEALVSDEPRMLRTTSQIINSAEHSGEIQEIMRRIEVSSDCI
jgi:hypothetical protein